MPKQVHVEVSVELPASAETVWDFTQDYGRRTSWDRSVLEARVETETPERVVWIRSTGGLTARFKYKLFERPVRTSLAMIDVQSPLFSGGGGSWSYQATEGGGTRWTQSNTLRFKSSVTGFFLAPLVRWILRRATLQAMTEAKRLMATS